MQSLTRSRILGASLLVCVSGLAGCTPFHFDDQDLDMLLDHEGDRLELRIQYDDVRAKSDRDYDRDKADSNLKRILAKERLLVLFDLPLDFEKAIDDEPNDEQQRLLMEEAESIVAGISILDAGATLDEGGRPSVWQRIEVKNVQRAVDALNDAFNYTLNTEMEMGADGVWDEQTFRLWDEKAEEGGRWILIDKRGLVLRIPMSAPTTARVLVELLDPEADEDNRIFAYDLLSPLSELRIVDGSVELIYAPDEDGVIHWNLRRSDLGEETPVDTAIVESDWFQAALPK